MNWLYFYCFLIGDKNISFSDPVSYWFSKWHHQYDQYKKKKNISMINKLMKDFINWIQTQTGCDRE